MRLFDELRERRMAPYLVAFVAGGWIVLQVVDQLADRGVLPELSYRIALAVVAACLPGAIIVAWFHGAKGHQEMPRIEAVLLTLVGLLATLAGVGVWRAGAAPTATAELDPDFDPRRVAVLYFDARGGGEDATVLADGLTEALIDELGAVGALTVISRNGVAPFRGTTVAADSIGRALHVGTIVSGVVQAAGDRVRINVSMVNGQTGQQLESRRLEAPRADLFDLQDELSEEVAYFLRERIGAQFELLAGRAQAGSVEAWELVQRAQRLADEALDVATTQTAAASRLMLEADSVLERAEREDPEWVVPPTRRGWLAYRQSRLTGFDRSEYERWIELGLVHAARALALDGAHPNALELRGTLRYWQYLLNLAGNREETERALAEAERDLRAAIRENRLQASAGASLSHLLLNRNNPVEAKLVAQRSYEADPYLRNADLTLWRLFSASITLGDEVEARRWCQEGLRRFPEDSRFFECQIRVMALPGSNPDIDEAWRLHQRVLALRPAGRRELDDHVGRMWIALALFRAGLPDSARAVASSARVGPDIDPLRDAAFIESIVRTWLGEEDEAVRLLGIYLAANPGLSFERPFSWWLADLDDNADLIRLLESR